MTEEGVIFLHYQILVLAKQTIIFVSLDVFYWYQELGILQINVLIS